MRPGLLLALTLALALAACDSASPPASAGPGKASGLDAGPSPDAGVLKTRLFEPGKEPRAPLSFIFREGGVERAQLELTSVLSRDDKTLGEERVKVRLSVRYAERHAVEIIVLDASTTAPEVQHVDTTAGMLLTQRFHPLGATEALPKVMTPKQASARAADYIHGALMQLASGLLPVVPVEPVGEGARWAHDDLRFELLARRGDDLAVERRSERKGMNKLVTGELVSLSETQTYRIETRTGYIARRIEAVLVADQPNGTVITTRLRFEPEAQP
jgi:hypothetical protein